MMIELVPSVSPLLKMTRSTSTSVLSLSLSLSLSHTHTHTHHTHTHTSTSISFYLSLTHKHPWYALASIINLLVASLIYSTEPVPLSLFHSYTNT